MKVSLIGTLTGEVTQEVTDAVVGIHGLHTPHGFQALSERWVIESGFTAHESLAQPELARGQLWKALRDDLFQACRVRRCTRDRINTNIENCTYKQFAASAAIRHDQSTGTF